MKLVNQGRYILSTDPVCGTNGLGSCVGLAVYHGSWFIAHIDCEAIVKKKGDPMAQKITDYVKNRLNQILGPCGSPNVHAIGNFTTFEAIAIVQGITDWVNGHTPIVHNAWDGFQIKGDGTFAPLGHEANNDNGTGPFTVPENP